MKSFKWIVAAYCIIIICFGIDNNNKRIQLDKINRMVDSLSNEVNISITNVNTKYKQHGSDTVKIKLSYDGDGNVKASIENMGLRPVVILLDSTEAKTIDGNIQ